MVVKHSIHDHLNNKKYSSYIFISTSRFYCRLMKHTKQIDNLCSHLYSKFMCGSEGQNILTLRWQNTVFLYLCIIHCYFQTTGIWAAKIGTMQVQLKRLYFDMFYWAKYHCHGNTAGNKPALNNGFALFSENPFISFSTICPWKTQKNSGLLTLVSCNFDREFFCNLVFCI